jgi:hypothetical protein
VNRSKLLHRQRREGFDSEQRTLVNSFKMELIDSCFKSSIHRLCFDTSSAFENLLFDREAKQKKKNRKI